MAYARILDHRFRNENQGQSWRNDSTLGRAGVYWIVVFTYSTPPRCLRVFGAPNAAL